MQWGKLQVVQEPDHSKTQSSKNEPELLFSQLVKSVTVKLLLLKGTHKNHV